MQLKADYILLFISCASTSSSHVSFSYELNWRKRETKGTNYYKLDDYSTVTVSVYTLKMVDKFNSDYNLQFLTLIYVEKVSFKRKYLTRKQFRFARRPLHLINAKLILKLKYRITKLGIFIDDRKNERFMTQPSLSFRISFICLNQCRHH